MTGDRVPKRFHLSQVVKVPEEISKDLKAIVVGIEWGPDNKRAQKNNLGVGWCYHIRKLDSLNDPWTFVSEQQLLEWQG